MYLNLYFYTFVTTLGVESKELMKDKYSNLFNQKHSVICLFKIIVYSVVMRENSHFVD